MNRRTQFNQKIKCLTCFPIRPPSPYFSVDYEYSQSRTNRSTCRARWNCLSRKRNNFRECCLFCQLIFCVASYNFFRRKPVSKSEPIRITDMGKTCGRDIEREKRFTLPLKSLKLYWSIDPCSCFTGRFALMRLDLPAGPAFSRCDVFCHLSI